MAKVNHKRVKQLLDEKRSKITDRQFFTSRILAGHFEDMAAAQTKRYGFRERIRVHLYWKAKDTTVAWTDHSCITINCGSRMITKVRGRQSRYMIVLGLFAHELGHLLGTDFLVKQTYLNYLERGKWYPAPPELTTAQDSDNEKQFWEFFREDPRNPGMILTLVSRMENIYEDGYVENLILNRFPGVLGYGLETLRELQLKNMPTVTQMIEDEGSDERLMFVSILQNMLSYAKYGQIKYGEEPLTDPRIQTVFQLIPEMDSAVTDPDARNRWQTTGKILIRCWHYAEPYLRLCRERQSDASDGDCGGSGGIASSIPGMTAEGEGTTAPVLQLQDPEHDAASSDRAKTRALSASVNPGNAQAPAHQTEQAPSEGPEADGPKELSDPDAETDDPDTEKLLSEGEQDAAPSGKQTTSAEESSRIPFHQTESVSEPLGGTTAYDEAYEREMNSQAASDIERVLENMAEKAACVQVENERLRELNETAQNISYGNVHAGVQMEVHRIADVDDELQEQYDAVSAPLLTISRQLQRSLVQKLRDQQRGGKQTGLVMGRRLDAHALCRNDGKVFYRNALPNEIPRLSVGLLLDESGSMSCGDRSTYARAAAVILYDFCQSLDIPIMIYGHSTGYGADVDLYSYAEFDEVDRDDKYRLMDISARGCNRDGAALRYVAEQLSKRTEEIRLLILVSDGQPSAYGYDGTAAEEDLRGIQQEYRRKGILFVAAGIGEDKEVLERIYGTSYLDITDLNQMPTKLTAVIKRFLRL